MSPRRPMAVVFAALLSACSGTGPTAATPPPLEPRRLADVPAPAREAGRPTVALVLGGGGIRGFAHLGVLRALDEAGVRPDLVVGTSVGAIVGAAYASGLEPARIDAIARGVELGTLVDWTFSSSGLMRGRHLARWVDGLTGGVPIEQFPIRFAAVATDLHSEAPVLIDRGGAGAAIQASTAVPGVTVPVAYAGGHLVDGGVASVVPVRAARALGADVVIAVDIYCHSPRLQGQGALSVLQRVMQAQGCALAASEMAEADVLIAPVVQVSGIGARDEQARAMQIGYEAARAALPRIRRAP